MVQEFCELSRLLKSDPTSYFLKGPKSPLKTRIENLPEARELTQVHDILGFTGGLFLDLPEYLITVHGTGHPKTVPLNGNLSWEVHGPR